MEPNFVQHVAAQTGLDPDRAEARGVAGGSIASAWRLSDTQTRLFVKCLPAESEAILDAERDGLARLAAAGCVRTPAVISWGRLDDVAWLAFEWCDMRRSDEACFARLGHQLCEQHRRVGERFGLSRDNFIGATPQRNTPTRDWGDFFFRHRLAFQLDRLHRRTGGFGARTREHLEKAWRRQVEDYRPEPSLLHGDLWNGNTAMLADGTPLVFDPAVHYGDRECDLAMADLFGGFSQAFFDAYRGAWLLEPGWEERRRYYQLYHLLNHANLFGGHYIGICRKLIDDLGNA